MPGKFLISNVHLATFDSEAPYGAIQDGALAIENGRIAWLGKRSDVPAAWVKANTLDGRSAWLTPGLIDCHTHLVYAGNRAQEFELRLNGATYEEIANAGGGINATVRSTHAASESELLGASRRRLDDLASEGVTTVEIKSGYGLDVENEAKILRVARTLGAESGLRVRTTLLAAHTVPPEFAFRQDDYIDYVCADIVPAIVKAGLADAVDVFCERMAFTPEQTARVFEVARHYSLPVKLHADQLSDSGGSHLAARFNALSADHLEYASEQGIADLAQARTVAVLLPGAFYFLRERQVPPVKWLRMHRVPIALATDCNPGTSPITSLLLVLNLACTLFRLTPREALAGVTRYAAQALGIAQEVGTLTIGKHADLALWAIHEPAELAYAIGANPCCGIVREGKVVRWDT